MREVPEPLPNESLGDRQYSLFALLAISTAFAGFFGLAKAFGAYGFVLGIFLLMFSIGQVTRYHRWRVAGLAGALTLVGTLLAAWLWFGTVETLHNRLFRWPVYNMQIVEKCLHEHQAANGEFPESLS